VLWGTLPYWSSRPFLTSWLTFFLVFGIHLGHFVPIQPDRASSPHVDPQQSVTPGICESFVANETVADEGSEITINPPVMSDDVAKLLTQFSQLTVADWVNQEVSELPSQNPVEVDPNAYLLGIMAMPELQTEHGFQNIPYSEASADAAEILAQLPTTHGNVAVEASALPADPCSSEVSADVAETFAQFPTHGSVEAPALQTDPCSSEVSADVAEILAQFSAHGSVEVETRALQADPCSAEVSADVAEILAQFSVHGSVEDFQKDPDLKKDTSSPVVKTKKTILTPRSRKLKNTALTA
jgi:hypothetical protein